MLTLTVICNFQNIFEAHSVLASCLLETRVACAHLLETRVACAHLLETRVACAHLRARERERERERGGVKNNARGFKIVQPDVDV